MPTATMTADATYWNRRATDNDAAGMVGWASHPFEAHENYVALLLAGIVRPGSRVLDVGCGYGRFAECVTELKAEWVGVDFSEGMKAVYDEEVGLGTFILADARQPKADWGKFTTILCVGANQVMGLGTEQFKELYAPFVKKPGNIVLVGPYTTTIHNLF